MKNDVNSDGSEEWKFNKYPYINSSSLKYIIYTEELYENSIK